MAKHFGPHLLELVKRLENIKDMVSLQSEQDKNGGPWIAIRLHVDEDGKWKLHTGTERDKDYEGLVAIDYVGRKTCCLEVAKNLIEEIQDYAYIAGVM